MSRRILKAIFDLGNNSCGGATRPTKKQKAAFKRFQEKLADAMVEDILKTPDNEILREVEEDYGDPLALAKQFDKVLEQAKRKIGEGK